MILRTGARIAFVACVLALSVSLLGCPKRPGVTQAGAGAIGPSAAVAPSPIPSTAPTAPRMPTVSAPRVGETPVTRPTSPVEARAQAGPGVGGPAPAPSPLKDVFFDFDKSDIRDDQKAALNDNVSWLRANARAKISIEGHCDERGTPEYNLGLGERRAKAVKDYVVNAGIASDRIATISYGKERPFVLGHDESAWKWNRRGHFMISGQ
jgi:peptidoglycan-associated lipoprotein